MVQDNTHPERTNGRGTAAGLSRRAYLKAAGAASVAGAVGFAGCSGSTGSGDGNGSGSGSNGDARAKVPKGVPKKVKTKYWHDWPTLSKKQQKQGPPLDYTARAGAALDPITMEFSNEDNPWMKQHAIMVRSGINELGAPTQLVARPLNQLYADSWTPAGLENVLSMSTHGPDPQRGLDPNPLMMRRYKESPSNYDKYWHPKLNKLLPKQRKITQNKQKRAEMMKKCEAIFAEDVGGLITVFPDVITAANTQKFKGYVPTPGNGPTRDSFQWSEVNLQPQTDETTYVKGVTTSVGSLNLPWSGGGAGEKRLKYIYDGLFDAAPTPEGLKIVPALATGGGFVDKKTVELDLREGVKWHDGKSFSPEDIKFSVDYYKQYTATSQTPFYTPIKSVEVLSKTGGGRVRFNLKYPDASFMTQRVVVSAIIPKHKWKDIKTPSQYNPQNPVGTGPFQFKNWDSGTQLVVERWDGNWKWDEKYRSEALGKYFRKGPGIEGLTWVNVGNVDAMIGALNNGEIDAIDGVLSITQAERASRGPGIEMFTTKNFAPLDLKLMFSAPLIRDKEFRIALSKVVDKRSFVKSTLQGEGELPVGHPISPILGQFYNSNTKQYKYDTDEARTILERAGYTWSSGGSLRYPNGKAWGAFVERIQNGNTHKRRSELGQPNFAKSNSN
jgi:peptide/nickel transport system substrate-binding protein